MIAKQDAKTAQPDAKRGASVDKAVRAPARDIGHAPGKPLSPKIIKQPQINIQISKKAPKLEVKTRPVPDEAQSAESHRSSSCNKSTERSNSRSKFNKSEAQLHRPAANSSKPSVMAKQSKQASSSTSVVNRRGLQTPGPAASEDGDSKKRKEPILRERRESIRPYKSSNRR